MIIGISGKKQTGKDMIGRMLIYLLSYKNENGMFKQEPNYNLFEQWNKRLNRTFTSEYINEGYSYSLCGWKIKKFAGHLKTIVSLLTGCNINDLEKEEFKNSKIPQMWINVSYRDMLKSVGAIMRKYFCEYTWINALFKDYKDTSKWIITDLRYKNEAEFLLEKNAILIRVNRNLKKYDSSESECDLDNYNKFHYYIDNNGTLEELFIQVKNIYEQIKNKI